jgi:hypothetical protein
VASDAEAEPFLFKRGETREREKRRNQGEREEEKPERDQRASSSFKPATFEMETVICSEGNVKWSLGTVLGKGLSAQVHVATKGGEDKKVIFSLSLLRTILSPLFFL